MSGRYNHWTGHSLVSGILPSLGADTPPVSRRKSRESVIRHGGNQIVSLRARELQELLGHHATNGMQTSVIAIGVATPIPVPTSEGLNRARIQFTAENVE